MELQTSKQTKLLNFRNTLNLHVIKRSKLGLLIYNTWMFYHLKSITSVCQTLLVQITILHKNYVYLHSRK